MNKDQFKGRAEEAKGAIKETAGRVAGKPNVELEGAAEKVAGRAQKTYGDAKENLKKPQ